MECLKLTSYFGERHRTGHDFTGNALLDLYASKEIAASILFRGTQRFGLRRHLRTDRSLALSEDLPLLTVAVDARPRIEAVLEQILSMTTPGLVTLEHACLLDGDGSMACGAPGSQEEEAKLGHRQRARFLSRQAEVPMMVVAVGARDQIMRVLPDVSGVLRHPLLTLEPVRVCKRDGLFLGIPDRSPGTDEYGMELWQKLMVYTSEAAQNEGQPLHRALCQRLLAAGVRGVTTLRGIWGFHGDHAPHGDSALRLGHHVPAVTIVIDIPERIPAAFAIIDQVTGERGLVTSETVPAIRAPAPGRTG